MTHRQRARRHDSAAIRGAGEGRDRALSLSGIAHADRDYIHADCRRHGLDDGELADPGGQGGPRQRRRPERPNLIMSPHF